MCDAEHMFDCPAPSDSNKPNRQMTSELESFLARQFGDKNFVAKKFGYEVSMKVNLLNFFRYAKLVDFLSKLF